jgi:phosphatidate cytidylyltransferase
LSTFLRRTLTAVWIVIFVLGGFWLHPISFFLTGLVIIAGAQYEYYSMVRTNSSGPQTLAGIITGVTLYTLSTLSASGIISPHYLLLLIPLGFIILVIELFRRQEKPFDSLAHTFFAVLYIALPFSLFPHMAYSYGGLQSILPHGSIVFSPGIIVGFFLLLWANDTGAYILGVTFGKHRLFERISPKKSWEGFAGGLIVSLLIAWLLSGWLGVTDRYHWLAISLIISISGTLGDLAESMLKRSIGVKDSGNIMPGHGGFLDRFDSTFISFPLVYLFISLFG